MNWRERLDDVERMREIACGQGGAEAVAKQHARGRLTIRERIDGVLDPGSFTFVDEPGFMIGPASEREGTLRACLRCAWLFASGQAARSCSRRSDLAQPIHPASPLADNGLLMDVAT